MDSDAGQDAELIALGGSRPDRRASEHASAGQDNALRLTIGIVVFRNTRLEITRLLQSIAIARRHCRQVDVANLRVTDNAGGDCAEIAAQAGALALPCEAAPSAGEIGFAAAHNVLMRSTFATGGGWYLSLQASGFLHAAAFTELVAFLACQPRPGLVDLRQIPSANAHPYDPLTGRTACCSLSCLLIPRVVQDVIGGFDEALRRPCGDVAYSSRAQTAGYPCSTAARAVFVNDVPDRRPNVADRTQTSPRTRG